MGLLLYNKHLLPFFILSLFCSYYSCYSISSTDEDLDTPLSLSKYLDHHESSSAYDNQAYPTFFGFFDDHPEGEFVSDLIEYQTEGTIGLEKFDEAVSSHVSSSKVVSVVHYGAKGDGSSDDTQAFQKAWKAACISSSAPTLVVPKNKNYLLKPVTFSGPCKSALTLQIDGTIEASDDRNDYKKDQRHWITIQKVQNLNVEGGGTIDGKGDIWWKNSCKRDKSQPCTHAPTAVTFLGCQNLKVSNIEIKDAQQMHLAFQKCVNVQALNLIVSAPGNSPNTDGIHVTETQNILIKGCIIGTGDDCISIVSGSQKVQANDITCGPGHGISIGSLGAGKSEDHVSDVHVDSAKLTGATNGVRIKTWQGGSGSASNIIFENISMDNVSNPIILDQNYCDQKGPCKQQEKAVQVKNVVYRNIKGTSASETAIKFDCSKSHPCSGIVMENIDLVGDGDKTVKALCNNVKWTKKSSVSPSCP